MPENKVNKYNVYYKLANEADSAYKIIDTQLIRKYPTYYRADILGLKAGNYTLKIEEDGTNLSTITSATVTQHDRSGFAHFSYSEGVGAYNNDGTLKAGAQVLYLTQSNINTCKLTINGKEYIGIKNITQAIKIKNKANPIAIRIIGKVDAGIAGTGLSCSDMNSAYALGVKEAQNVTFEGVGDDATLYNAGIAAFKCKNIEVRNLGFMNWGGGSDGDGISIKESEHVWIHNNDIFYGNAGSDGDQAKGDGSLDLKDDTKYMTVSYIHFWDSGKMSLCGMKSESGENFITYHHNWFDHSDSRHPRVRTMTVHVYNNYYDGVSKYGMATATGAQIFSEANYFKNSAKPYLIGGQGTEAGQVLSGEKGGVIKAYNDYFETTTEYKAYSVGCGTNFDVYVVNSRDEVVPSTVVTIGGYTYNNFDTDSTKMYTYTADSPEEAKNKVMAYAGRMNGGDFSWTFTDSDNSSYSLNSALKNALNKYVGPNITIQGIEQSSSSSSGGSNSSDDENQTPTPVVTVEMVISAINDIGTVTATSGAKIYNAKNIYESLSANDKLLVTNINTLNEAIQAYELVKPDALDSLNITANDDFATYFNITGTTTTTKPLAGEISSGNGVTAISKEAIENINKITIQMSVVDKGSSSVEVYYSLDCGTTWQLLNIFKNGSNNNLLTNTYDCNISGPVYIKLEIKCSKAASNPKTISISSLKIE